MNEDDIGYEKILDSHKALRRDVCFLELLKYKN